MGPEYLSSSWWGVLRLQERSKAKRTLEAAASAKETQQSLIHTYN